MKLSVKWLKTLVDTKLTAEKIADKLTMAGLEVDEIIGGTDFTGVVVGHVLSVEKHANADKLNVAQIDTGDEKLQIVCGATNLKRGQNVPVALVGAKLGDYEITKATLRGVDSFGMICSERELGISDEHAGILVLPESVVIGTDVSLLTGGDKVLDVKVLANRPDCMSVIGLANEVAVTTGSKLSIPAIKLVAKGPKVDFSVTVKDKELCPRYMARFATDVQKGESPVWMKERLVSAGVRPISLFVDISNYVMLEYGQPLHFFDLDKLADKTIVVRPAKKDETIVTLDGTKRTLTADNLVIANSEKAIALAGVMGGLDTEIDENTKNILVEAAIFDKASVRRTSRALGLRSEAVARFEKGIPHMYPEVAINRAAELLAELASGTVSETVIDEGTKAPAIKPIIFDNDKMNAFLGTKVAESDSIAVLTSLGFAVKKSGKAYEVAAPFWRIDIAESVDLYEEVIRIIGFDHVPLTLPAAVPTVPAQNMYHKTTKQIRNRLAAIGFDEILTYSFIGSSELSAVGVDTATAPKVQNPLVSDQEYLRPTLAPKMLEAIRDNQYHRDAPHFFEIGKSFVKTTEGKLPKETNWLTLGLTTDYYDAKEAIYNLLATFGILDGDIVVKPTTVKYLKQGMGADFFVHGKKLASAGEVREQVRTKFDIKRSVTLAELDIDILLNLDLSETKFVAFSKFQAVTRDISAIFGMDITVAEIRQKLVRIDKLITDVAVVDIYTGKKLEAGERSITIRFTLQSDIQTLTDAEVESVMKLAVAKIAGLGGKVRTSA
jgi:phenylalanyl-tRNA synthetase beta chain